MEQLVRTRFKRQRGAFPPAGVRETQVGLSALDDQARSSRTGRLQLYLLVFAVDLFAIAAGFVVAGQLRLGTPFSAQALRTIAVVVPIFAAIAFHNGAYSIAALRRPSTGAARAAEAVIFAIVVSTLLLFSLKISEDYSRLVFGIGTAVSIAALIGSRLILGDYIGRRYRWRFAKRLVIADGECLAPEPGDHVVFPEQLGLNLSMKDPFALDRLGAQIQSCDSVLVACPPDRRAQWVHLLKSMAAEIEIHVPDLVALGGIRLNRTGNQTTLVIGHGPLDPRQRIAKRCLDVVLTATTLIFLLPLMIAVAVAIKIDSPGPILFRQQRLGHNNRLFHLLKFRSMRVDATDASGARSASPWDDRVTRVGKFIRRTSIDELPQLINVLFGEMSIVGPRPHALGSTAENKVFWDLDDRYFHRHAIKPGITGLAQVRGFRGATVNRRDLSNRLHSDLEYLSGWTIWRDLKIIGLTFRVLAHPNAY